MLSAAGLSHADPITINLTGDNEVRVGVCTSSDCSTYDAEAATANFNDWRRSDSVIFDLAAGTHQFLFEVTNWYSFGSGNPAALLAEILWDGGSNVSSSAWEVTYDFTNPLSWFGATEWGTNGGTNIWTNNNGGNPVGGIATNANWLWTPSNFADGGGLPTAYFRTSIDVRPVPEPGTLALLGVGLLGMGFARRRQT